MAVHGLIQGFAHTIIEAKDLKSKPQEKCKAEHYYQKEQSRKSVFHWLRWQLESFYGRMFRQKRQYHAFQEVQLGRNVFKQKIKLQKTLFLTTLINVSWYFIASAVRDLKSNSEIAWLKISGFLFSMWTNKRLRWGLFMLLIIAPASKFVYLLFPANGFGAYFVETSFLTIPNFIETSQLGVVVDEWYFQYIYYWVWTCGELWAPLIAIYGIFLLFPKNYSPSYLVGIPFGYFLSLLIHRMFVTTSAEYHEGVGASVIVLVILLGVVMFVLSDKLLFNQNHRKRATEARIVGLINMPGLPWEMKEEMLKKEARDWQKSENELYDQTG